MNQIIKCALSFFVTESGYRFENRVLAGAKGATKGAGIKGAGIKGATKGAGIR